jgi:outer membrane receptor protein involved in Fe transport
MAREDIHGRGTHRRGWRLLATLLGSTAMAGAALAQQAETRNNDGIGEIIITAEKRASTVQETPISLTALSGDQLQAQGTSGVTGIIAEVPGISMRSSGPGQTELEMRGLASSGGSSPTVGFYLDETPLSPPAAALNGKVVIDPDLFDLNRAEVLRGPQGTLYGSGSMGGTIKLVTNQPNLQKVEGNIDMVLSGTPGGGVNTGGNAMLNVPIIDDKLAVRVVVTDKWNAGWIDRDTVSPFPFPVNPCPTWGTAGCERGNVLASPVTHTAENVNWEHLTAGRASVLYKPSEDFSIDTTAMYQQLKMGGYSAYDQSTGSSHEAHYEAFDFAEPFSDSFAMIGTTINYALGFADLTSSTSFWKRTETQTQENGETIESLMADFFGVQQFTPVGFTEKDDSNQVSEELRLASNGDSRLQWLGGVFYSKFESVYNDHNADAALAYLSTGGAAANPTGIIYDSYNPYHITQYAVFGEGSYKVTDDIKVTVGLRWYDFSTTVDEMQRGIGTVTGNATPTLASCGTSASGVNPKFNVSWEPDKDLTIYGTVSKGFRPGGVNLPIPTDIGCAITKETYDPDTIWDYEIGEKAKLFGGKVTVNGDFFYIDWSGVQQLINQPCGYPLTANAGSARSYGPELEISAKITPDWTISGSGTYTNAQLTSVDPALTAVNSALTAGTPILNIPKFTESTSLTYSHSLNADYDVTARVTNSYVGSSTDISYTYTKLPAYDIVNFRTGLVGSAWSGYFFVNNLTDTRAALSVNTTAFSWVIPSLVRVATNQPRTIGIDVNYRF